MEYGIFNDEGIVEGGFASLNDALHAALKRYDAEDGLYVSECCHDHPEQPRETCEECNSDEEE